MNFLTRLKLRNKLILLMGFSAVALVVSNGLAASILRDRTYLADRIDKLRAAVDMTNSFANALEPQVASGQLTRDQATARLREAIHAMRFDAGDGYILNAAPGLDGVLVAHGTRSQPRRQGRVLKPPIPAASRSWTVRDALRDGNGTISYMFPKPGQTEPLKEGGVCRAVCAATRTPPCWPAPIPTTWMTCSTPRSWRLASIAGGILLFTLLAAWMINRDIAANRSPTPQIRHGESRVRRAPAPKFPASPTPRRGRRSLAATVLVFKQNHDACARDVG